MTSRRVALVTAPKALAVYEVDKCNNNN